MKIKPAHILIAFIGLVVVGSVALSAHRPKCPEDFPETDAGDADRLAAMNQWTNDYYDHHPGASLGEWAKARHQFYIDNGCTTALQKYEEAKQIEGQNH